MKIHAFQHVPFEGLASIEEWTRSQGHRLSSTRFFADDPLPEVESLDWLVVMGGPMNIYETNAYPWLTPEKRFIERAIAQDKTVIGICLGSQLIADVLGARVSRNRCQEIGWFPVELTQQGERSSLFSFFPKRFPVLHWHGDTFELPHGATHIAQSEGCENQAFVLGEKVIGLQFHLEATRESTQEIIDHCADELVDGPYIQEADQILAADENFRRANDAMRGILARLAPRNYRPPTSQT